MTLGGRSRNNWLSVHIDPSEREKIYQVIQTLDEQINSHTQNHFDPMDQVNDDVHMTAIFFGQNFHKINLKVPGIKLIDTG